MTSALWATPDHGEPVFVSLLRVRFHEVDGLGHVNNATYLNYLEQAAIDHASLLGLDMGRLKAIGGVFVAHRHEIEFLRPAFAGDPLRVTTWLGGARGARVFRHYLVDRVALTTDQICFGGVIEPFGRERPVESLVVRAVTEWVFVSESGQPRRIPGEVIDAFHGRGYSTD